MIHRKNMSRNHIVYTDVELNTMRKYLKDIAMVSNKGGYPEFEIGKLASIINMGGETVENYIEAME